MPFVLNTRIALPPHFRPHEVLALHARDAQQRAEKVDGPRITKGLVWYGHPALLQLQIDADAAWGSLAVDGRADGAAGSQPDLDAMVARMLGLSAAVDAFEQRHADHPVLGALLQSQKGLRVPASSTPFEALVWSITGQQISVAAAIALRRRMVEATDVQHSSGMLCYPDAAALAALGTEPLRGAGFSASKIATLQRVTEACIEGTLPMENWLQQPLTPETAKDIAQRLQAIKGIGPWTAHYTLLRGFGWLDGSLHGDVAVRKALARLLAVPSVSQVEAEQWLAAFAPWRALVAAHLWTSLSAKSY